MIVIHASQIFSVKLDIFTPSNVFLRHIWFPTAFSHNHSYCLVVAITIATCTGRLVIFVRQFGF